MPRQGSKHCIPKEFGVGHSGLMKALPTMSLDKLRALLIEDAPAGHSLC